MATPKPIVCTLNAVDRLQRGITWRDVIQRFATTIDEVDGGCVIFLRADGASLAKVRSLVEAERACCAWMTLELYPGRLLITAESQEGQTAIRTMLGLR